MSGVAALVLAVVFTWAAVAKGLAGQRLLPAVEVAVAVVLLAFPSLGGAMALVLLTAFSVYVMRAIRAGAPCHCFGATHQRPASGRELVRNALLATLAVVALLGA